jgi:hypothetical protein
MPIRFHLDEHISTQIAAGLRRRKIDVTTCADAQLIRATDLEQLAFGQSSGRVLVTQDSDFLRLHASGLAHAGIAFCPPGLLSVSQILHRLVLIHDVLLEEEMRNHVEFL